MALRTKARTKRAAVAPADLVSVIIPAYNAAATIDETLRSVRAQSHKALEILVVDDGSTDETPAIAEAHALEDRRVRLIRQKNGGVARARNRGIEEARGAFIAPVDADDLWRPNKIAAQIQVMRDGGEEVGLVYTWFALIDDRSRVYEAHNRPTASGDVLAALYRGNVVGNGSSPLMRKAAVIEAGGYEPKLRDLRAQGCEDLLLYSRIAERWRFALTPAFLTGYRQSPVNMSGDVMQMVRSWEIVSAEMRGKRPDLAADLNAGECALLFWLYARSLEARQFKRALRVLAHTARTHPGMALKTALVTLAEAALWPFARLGRRPRPTETGALAFLDPHAILEASEPGPRIAYWRLFG